MTDPAALVLAIDAAFAADPPWDEETPIRPDSAGDPRIEHTFRGLRGVRWRDVPFEALDALRSSIPFLSNAAFRFALPAFMTYGTTDPARAGNLLADLVLTLTPPDNADVSQLEHFTGPRPVTDAEWMALVESRRMAVTSGTAYREFADRVAGLTGDQHATVRSFLEYLRDVDFDEAAATALQRYWASC
ncbi:MAG: hypothetical protein LC775_12360 [Acidobacteria bacterium]|nr:hypothetical protein [Acidobacteriota bacterium]